jgi:hypothetical protein
MNSSIHVPNSLREAGRQLRFALATQVSSLSKPQFVNVWSSVAYLFPNLHPDCWDDADGNWPRILRPFAAEAWRRAEDGELSDDELYLGDAQWCGLYDRIFPHTAEEMERRLKLAAGAGTAEV